MTSISQDFIVVSKLEAAERQLDQAILLFFGDQDIVSVHTLTTAAYQIIADVCKHRGIPREIEDSPILEQFGIKREVLAVIRKPQNFFKHGNKDHTDTVQLNPMLSVCFIMSAVQSLLQLRTRQSPECKVFRLWFFLRLPERMPPEIKKLDSMAKVTADPHDLAFFQELIQLVRLQDSATGAA